MALPTAAHHFRLAISVAAFALTLNTTAFFVILGASVLLLWLSTLLIQRNTGGAHPADP
jgi:hypothetical protein